MSGRYDKIIDEFKLEIYQCKNIIDCACGLGEGLPILNRRLHPKALVGVDILSSALKFAVRYKKDNVALIKSCITKLTFESIFDLFFCLETLEHLSPGMNEQAVSVILKAITTSGILLVSVPFDEIVCMQNCRHKQFVSNGTLIRWFGPHFKEWKSFVFAKNKNFPERSTTVMGFFNKKSI